jgi:hypothetical protein
VTVYENDNVFSKNLDALFESLQIPDENLGAAEPVQAMARSLANRMCILRATGFEALQRNRDAVKFLYLVRSVSEMEGYYAPTQRMINPNTVSPEMAPVRSGPGGQNPDGSDRAGGAGDRGAAV